MSLRDLVQEGRDIGLSGFAFRSLWELKVRSGWTAWRESDARVDAASVDERWYERAPFADPSKVGEWMRSHLSRGALATLRDDALSSLRGDIRCFGRWRASFGDPIDWHRDPVSGKRWPRDAHWTRALRAPGEGDVKFVWEVARFPHAQWLARIAGAQPEIAEACAAGLAKQIGEFREANPPGRGIHWTSGLEIALRAMSWTFAASVFGRLGMWNATTMRAIGAGILESAAHIEESFSFAEMSANNDHLIAEATALLMTSVLFPDAPRARTWRATAERVLTQEAGRQIDRDGGYFMYSHHYHRAVVQYYVLASRLAVPAPAEWTAALERSHRFLLAHVNPADGRVPNFGSNDGGLPMHLTTCDYSDFRPALQNVSRAFDEGPWDEESLWCGAGVSPAFEGRPEAGTERTAGFPEAGSFILRASDPSTFITFRCGTVRTRFAQIDMLHVDVWWKGENILVDGGTYLYNGPREWHEYFHRTASHNTITIDGADQMVHHRQFRVLYWTEARMCRYEDKPAHAYVSGEHYGYRRLPGNCTHHRSVLLLQDGTCIVYDLMSGDGVHDLRLHWQAGDFPFELDEALSMMTLHPRAGDYRVSVRRLDGGAAAVRVEPGWFSRYYGEKTAAPSLIATLRSQLPAGFVTVLSPREESISVEGDRWRVASGTRVVNFLAGPHHREMDEVVLSS